MFETPFVFYALFREYLIKRVFGYKKSPKTSKKMPWDEMFVVPPNV